MKTRFAFVGLSVFTVFMLSGCAQFMGQLRRDLDDRPPYQEPTAGGVFQEQNMLADYEFESPATDSGDDYRVVGHSERQPASAGPQGVSPNGEEGQGPVTYGSNPNLLPETRRIYKEGARARKEDFEDNAPNEGSLWASNGQTNYFFTKNKIKAVGDLVTVVLKERVIKDMATEIKKTLTQEEAEVELNELAQKRLLAANATKGRAPAQAANAGAQAPAPAATEEETKEVPPPTFQELDLTESLGVKDGEQMMAEIIERYPNGNYKVRATKRVPFKSETRLVTLVAIARASDVNDAETVESGNLYEYRIKAYR